MTFINKKNKFITIDKFFLLALITFTANCASSPEKKETPVVVEEMVIEEINPESTQTQPIIPSFYSENEALKVETITSDGDTTEYRIGDLYVIHRKADNDVISGQLFIVGGTDSYPKDKAGIELLAGSLATEGGTSTNPRDQFKQKLGAIGSSISSFAGYDWSGYTFRSISSEFKPTWDLFTQAILHPAMPQDEFQKQQAQMLATIASRLDDPDTQVSFESKQLMYKDNPYANIQQGTKESVQSLTLDEVKAFQQNQLDASKMLLVIVGKIAENQLLEAIKSSIGKLKGTNPGGEPTLPQLPPLVSKPDSYQIIKRELPTYYIIGLTPAPSATSPDFYPMLLANAYLSNKLFEEIRTKRNLTYAVDAGIMKHHQNAAYLYVTAVKPDETLREMYKVVAKLKESPITEEALTATKNTYITRIYMALQSNATQASLLASSLFLQGNWKEADKIIEHLNAVTTADIQRVANQYLQGYRFTLVGPKDDFPAELFDTTKLTAPVKEDTTVTKEEVPAKKEDSTK